MWKKGSAEGVESLVEDTRDLNLSWNHISVFSDQEEPVTTPVSQKL